MLSGGLFCGTGIAVGIRFSTGTWSKPGTCEVVSSSSPLVLRRTRGGGAGSFVESMERRSETVSLVCGAG